MPRKGISSADVILSIQALLERGEIPTAAGIRTELGSGSLTTIQKHFKKWKMNSFTLQAESSALPVTCNIDTQQALEELGALKQQQTEREQQYQILGKELLKKEQEALKRYQENLKLTENLQELTQSHKALWLNFEQLKQSYDDLKQEREATLERVLADKNKQIERLSAELQEVNATYLEFLREEGRSGDELLLQEKVRNIHMTDQIAELKNQNKALMERLDKESKLREPLQKELQKQQTLLQQWNESEQWQSFMSKHQGPSQ